MSDPLFASLTDTLRGSTGHLGLFPHFYSYRPDTRPTGHRRFAPMFTAFPKSGCELKNGAVRHGWRIVLSREANPDICPFNHGHHRTLTLSPFHGAICQLGLLLTASCLQQKPRSGIHCPPAHRFIGCAPSPMTRAVRPRPRVRRSRRDVKSPLVRKAHRTAMDVGNAENAGAVFCRLIPEHLPPIAPAFEGYHTSCI
ncbi:hypothetical protein HMF8227_02818 [Saliniradius amylolyticus]|uniref:Uncharacterized protein n=1 Tax=Saliniradius amylolyticus TaxID=2183582 RepID=A0A2S2E8K3_9ALTE|nr:hypothetical protein HMF8227_02818 [Saliniradius amylolyticus]